MRRFFCHFISRESIQLVWKINEWIIKIILVTHDIIQFNVKIKKISCDLKKIIKRRDINGFWRSAGRYENIFIYILESQMIFSKKPEKRFFKNRAHVFFGPFDVCILRCSVMVNKLSLKITSAFDYFPLLHGCGCLSKLS